MASKKKQIKTFINPKILDLEEDYYDSNSEEDFIVEIDIANRLVLAALHFRKQHTVIKAKVVYISEINREDKFLNPTDYYYSLFKVEYKTNAININIPHIEARIRTLLVEYFIENPQENMILLGLNEQELFGKYPEKNQKCFGCGFRASGNNFLASSAGDQFLKCPKCNTHFQRTD